jgi:hypothetical protein
MSIILAIDLGKFNSVFCWYDPISKATEFRTVPTHEPEVREALLRQPNVTVVVEACSAAGWVHDIAVSLGLKVLVGAVCELARAVSAVQEDGREGEVECDAEGEESGGPVVASGGMGIDPGA